MTIHMPTNVVATPRHVCVGIRIQAIDVVHPPAICMPAMAYSDADQAIVNAALLMKSSTEMPKNPRSLARRKPIAREIVRQAVDVNARRAAALNAYRRTRRGGA